MSITENDWREEQKRVYTVTDKISRRIEQLEEEVGKVKTDVVDIRKHFWDDVTINLSTFDDVIETYFSMKQQAEVLSERERSYRHSAAALHKLTRLVRSPYFGRIDFVEDESGEVEQIYLGISSFQDQEDYKFWVYDWRAPVSSLYYDYPPGPAKYEAPGGEIKGTMTLKRQFVIRERNIRHMFDTGITIGDDLLQQVLSRTSDAQMKSIVATIQKEQNQIIRNDRCRMLIVQGAAGSGKTSAALQRVAYLLYKYRETLQADQMVLFSPNPLFNSYVSTVLPELGEENMQQTTFQEYLEHRLGDAFQLEDPFAQIEYILTSMDDPAYAARMKGIQYKSSFDYLNTVHAYKDLLQHEGMIFKSIQFRGRVLAEAQRLKEIFYSYEPSIRLLNRIELMRDWLLEELSAFKEKELDQAWVEREIELLEPEDYQRAYKKLRRLQKGKGETFNDFEAEKEIFARMVVEKQLEPLRKDIKLLRFVDVTALYLQLFKDKQIIARIAGAAGVPEQWDEICRMTIEKIESMGLPYEDATPYLYLKELVQGFESNNSVRHVIVDEAQDYSPFQLEFLKRLFPRCRMTALGDMNQAIYAHCSALSELDPIAELYGPEQTELIRLNRSYRSTREIVEFTRGMVAGGEEIVPFNRSGDKPRVTIVSDTQNLNSKIYADIVSLRSDGFESIAIICKTAAESAEVYSALKERVPVRIITKHTLAFEKETIVIPAYLAKGMEFDAVIIYNGSKLQYGRENERKLIYCACTRAMHLLHIYSIGEPSLFIADQPSETFVFQ